MRKISAAVLFVTTVLSATSSHAAELAAADGQVVIKPITGLERFQLNTDVGACPAGTWLNVADDGTASSVEKRKNAPAMVLAAYLSGKTVRVYVEEDVEPDPEGSCFVKFLWLR